MIYKTSFSNCYDKQGKPIGFPKISSLIFNTRGGFDIRLTHYFIMITAAKAQWGLLTGDHISIFIELS